MSLGYFLFSYIYKRVGAQQNTDWLVPNALFSEKYIPVEHN